MIAFVVSLVLSSAAQASTPDWSYEAMVPPGGRPNPYGFSGQELPSIIHEGKLQTLVYPIESTGMLLPYRPIKNFVESPLDNPFRWLLSKVVGGITKIRSMDEIYQGLGLLNFPEQEGAGAYLVPFPHGMKPSYRMGVSLISTEKGTGLTFSCATCHAGQIFGRTVIGMSNRFTRPEEFYIKGLKVVDYADARMFKAATGATQGETELFERSRLNAPYIETRAPQVVGVTAPMAHTALSLSHRAEDAVATRDPRIAKNPREEVLRTRSGDVKPAVWWNTRYKTRWFSDGSAAAGNPVIAALIVNEIGRGSDLEEVEDWLARNEDQVKALTTAVFSSEAPRFTDFFPAESLDLAAVKRGQSHFRQLCARCHGDYQKAWEEPGSENLAYVDLLKTTLVKYHERTPTKKVGTDPNRAEFMATFVDGMNRLRVSERFGIVSEATGGYVPQPLVGIWARWPYFHNNSAPSLCAVLTPSELRPRTYWAGEPIDRERDFDRDCNGYPSGDRVPAEWKRNTAARYDASLDGMGNGGHDRGIFIKDGKEVLSAADKRDLIRFLQTL